MKPSRRRKDALGWALIGAAFLIIGGVGAAVTLLRPPTVDAQTLCLRDAPIAAHTVILVDATDKLAPRHKKRLAAVVAQERARLQPYDRLTILALRPDAPQEPRLLFSKCLPRQPNLVNPLVENPTMAQAEWDRTIGSALESAVRRAGGGTGADQSPIAASVRAAAADSDFVAPETKRRFVLVSDLLENDAHGFSIYRSDAPATAVPGAALAGVSLRIVTLDRPDEAARQQAAREAFWKPFFAASGAAAVTWDISG
jgi:hypothetical protein